MTTTNIVKRGIILVLEGRQLFPRLSVLANLKLGAVLRWDKEGVNGDPGRGFPPFSQAPGTTQSEGGNLKRGRTANACNRTRSYGASLYGLAVSRLTPMAIEQLGETIKSVNKRGVSVVLVE